MRSLSPPPHLMNTTLPTNDAHLRSSRPHEVLPAVPILPNRKRDCEPASRRRRRHPLSGGEYLFSAIAQRANGARTLVRRKVRWRRGLEISPRGTAVPAFLRDKSSAPGEFLIGALDIYGGEGWPLLRSPSSAVALLSILRSSPAT